MTRDELRMKLRVALETASVSNSSWDEALDSALVVITEWLESEKRLANARHNYMTEWDERDLIRRLIAIIKGEH